jgi:hypothetical protein
MVLGAITTEYIDPITGKLCRSEAFAYSCKALLRNMKRQKDGCGELIGIISDATFNLILNGWCLSSVGCRSLYRTAGGELRQTYRPFCYLISRTERGDGYQLLYQCLKKALAWLGIENYVVKASCTDHHDGEIGAVSTEFSPGKIKFNYIANC